MLTILALTLAPLGLPADGWIAFELPLSSPAVQIGCGRKDGVSLDSRNTFWSDRSRGDGDHKHFTVFAEMSGGEPERMRAYTPDCRVTDADRAHRVEMTASDAVTLLEGWLEKPLPRSLSHEMIAVLAHIDSTAVNGALARLAEDVQRRDESQNALFWLAMRRGDQGRAIVMQHLQAQWPLQHRQHAVTALGLSKHPQALETVREIARTDEHPEMRASGVTALGIAKAPGALADLHSILLADEADTVREQAIFWLSQLKGAEVAGILADVARDPRYGRHRKTALFWLAHMSREDSEAVLDELMSEIL